MTILCVLQQADQKGVLIRRVEPTAPVNKSLKKGDILLSFDGVDIANDGTVPFRSGERISFNYLVSKKYTAEKVSSQTPDHCTPSRSVCVGQSASLVVTPKEHVVLGEDLICAFHALPGACLMQTCHKFLSHSCRTDSTNKKRAHAV